MTSAPAKITKVRQAKIDALHRIAKKDPEILRIKLNVLKDSSGVLHADEKFSYYYCRGVKGVSTEASLEEALAFGCRYCGSNQHVVGRSPMFVHGDRLESILECIACAVELTEKADPSWVDSVSKSSSLSKTIIKMVKAYASCERLEISRVRNPDRETLAGVLASAMKAQAAALEYARKRNAELMLQERKEEALAAVAKIDSFPGVSRSLSRKISETSKAIRDELVNADVWCLVVTKEPAIYYDPDAEAVRSAIAMLPALYVNDTKTLLQMPNYLYQHIRKTEMIRLPDHSLAPWRGKGRIPEDALEVVRTLHSDNPNLKATTLLEIAKNI